MFVILHRLHSFIYSSVLIFSFGGKFWRFFSDYSHNEYVTQRQNLENERQRKMASDRRNDGTQSIDVTSRSVRQYIFANYLQPIMFLNSFLILPL